MIINRKVNINMNFILLVIFGDFRITGVQNSTDTVLLLYQDNRSGEQYKSSHPSIHMLFSYDYSI